MHRARLRMFIGFIVTLAASIGWASPAQADTIASGESKYVSLSGGTPLRSWEFDATAGTRVVVTAATQTQGVPPEIFLYYQDPDTGLDSEGASTGSSLTKVLDQALTRSGSWLLVVQKHSSSGGGDVSVALALMPGSATSSSDSDGGPVASGSTVAGTLDLKADTDLFTFDGTMGDRVIVTVSDTSGTCQPEVSLYPPSGGDSEASRTGSASVKKLEARLAETGAYTIVVSDYLLNTEGTYVVSFVKVPGDATSEGDADGGPIASGSTLIGLLSPRTDTDVFTFEGTAGERVIVTTADFATNTQTEIYLYPPDGADAEASSVGAFNSHRLERQLSATGTYTVVVHDSGLNSEGYYAISLVKIPGAATSEDDEDGGPLVPGSTEVGRLLNRADTDVWRFRGEAGARAVIATADFGGGIQPEIYLYPEGGGELLASSRGASTRHRVDVNLPSAGLYTVVVTDYQNRHDDGYYAISLATFPGPLSSPGDRDGGPVEFDRTVRASISAASDLDCWQFYGRAGDQVTITAARAATGGGTVEPDIYLYPPDQGAFEASVAGAGASHRLVWQLKQSGLYTVLVNDDLRTRTGSYDLTVSKSPPTRAPGIYHQFPQLGATVSDLAETLRWAAVSGATSYDVRFGDDLLAELPVLGAGLGSPAVAFPAGLAADAVYYWHVVAHTPTGDVTGPVLWFRTSGAPIVAADDFSDGDITGDRNWFSVAGVWRVNGGKQYYSTPLVTPYIQDNRAVFPSIGNFVVGEFGSRVSLTSSVVRGRTSPNAELAFAFSDAFHYRFVRFRPGKVEIGQTGAFHGDNDRSKRAKKVRAVPARGAFDVRVIVLSNGQVRVFLKKPKAASFPVKPALTYKFKAVAPGFLGYRALGARSLFDNFNATVRAFVQ